MKKTFLTVAFLITVMTATLASGDSSSTARAHVIPAPNDRFKVLYTAPDVTVVNIKLWDERGHLLRYDRIKSKGGFLKPYDFSSVEKGTYFIELIDKYGVLKEQVEVANQANADYMAVKALENNKYKLIVAHENPEPFSVTIYNSDNVVVHKEHHTDRKGFTRTYDLSGMDSGNFTFELTDLSSTKIVSIE